MYVIRNLLNEKVYVGSAEEVEPRWRIHRHHLRTGRHHSRHLQRAWDRYGERRFEFRVVEIVRNKAELIEREQYWINKTKCTDRCFGYNVTPTAGSQRGYRHSPETRIKMSERGRGRKLPPEWRASISKAMLGVEHSEAARQKLSEAHARLSKGQVFALLDAYAAGIAQQDLADQYGVSLSSTNGIVRGKRYRGRVGEWLRERGLDALPFQPRSGAKLTKQEIFDVYDRKRRGETHREIARRYDISMSLVSQTITGQKFPRIRKEWIKINGITDEDVEKMTGQPSRLSRNDIYNIMALTEKAIKQRTIARRFGVTPATICDIVKGRTHREDTKEWRVFRSQTKS